MNHELTRIKRINTNYIFLFSFFFFLFSLTACVSVPNYGGLGKPQDLVPFSSRVLTGHLPNGLRYYILENSLPENRAHLGLVVNAGSVLERDDQRGFAHFIEHLAFSDTVNFPDLQIQEYLRSLGMRFGPDFNANTSHERTLYYFDIPVENQNGIKKIPEKGLAILDDWTHQITFKKEFVDSERRVILEEMRTRSGADERISRILLPLLFAGSAYENREVLGLEETIINSTQSSLKAFYDRWYTSDNMALVFIGDFDGMALKTELENHFTMLKAAQPVNRPRHELPPPKKGNFHVEIITDPEVTTTSFDIYLKQKPASQKGTLAYYRETLVDYLISVMINQRFEEEAENPDSASTRSWSGPFYWASRSKFYTMGTIAKTGKAEEALIELLEQMESMKRGFGFTESELHRAKLNLMSYMEKQLSEKDRRESRSFLRGFVSNFLYNDDFADIEWEVEACYALLQGIGINEIARTAKNYFSHNDIIVILTSPEKEEELLPSKERITQIFRDSNKLRVSKRQDEINAGDLLDALPKAGQVISEAKDNETDSVMLNLSNGVKIILKETQNRNNEITMYALAKGGTINAKESADVSAKLLSEMVQVSGLGPYSRTELVNMLAGKEVSFSFWTSNYYRGFQGSSTTQDIKTLFEMIHLFFTQPKLDERAVAAMLDQYRTQLVHKLEDPQTVFFNEVTKVTTNNHPRFKPIELGDMDKVSIEDAFDFFKDCLNIQDYSFVFTGNIDIEKIKEYASVYLASVEYAHEQTHGFNSFTDPNIIRPQNIQRTINKGKDDRSMVYLAWYARGENQFNEKRNQVSSVLDEYLDILLNDEIREKLGGVYGISEGSSVSVIPRGENSLYVYFVCNPERAEELIDAVINTLQNMANRPLNPDTFNQAKEALLMQHQRSVQRNLHIAQSYANSFVLYDTHLSRLNNRPNVIREVTSQEVQNLLRQILSAGPVRIVLYPENF